MNKPINKRRTGTQIIMGILYELRDDRARKTRLLNVSQLNSKNFQNYFEYLIEKGYIEQEPNKEQEPNSSRKRDLGYYILTATGKTYLDKLENLRDFNNKKTTDAPKRTSIVGTDVVFENLYTSTFREPRSVTGFRAYPKNKKHQID